jgi:8-oxo-dGTP diphosphatase
MRFPRRVEETKVILTALKEISKEFVTEIEILRQPSNSVYDYGSFKINLIPFIANYISGEIKLSEHKDYKLLNKVELLKLIGLKLILQLLRNFNT